MPRVLCHRSALASGPLDAVGAEQSTTEHIDAVIASFNQ